MYSNHNPHGQRPRHNFRPQPPLPNAATASNALFAPARSPFDQLASSINSLSLTMSFPETQHHVHRLNSFVIATPTLQKAGYIVYPLGAKDLEMKKRCGRCHKAMFKGMRKKQPKTPPKSPLPEDVQTCKYHSGRIANKSWTCCNKHLSSPPCASSPEHVESNVSAAQIAQNWLYHATPTFVHPHPPLTAIAIDCEMGTAESGESELIRLTALDFFTGQVLVDSLVYPDVRMAHYNTRFSGVTRGDMEAARRNKTCFFGRDAARKALWKYVSPTTVVVGHGANGDFSCLRWIHPRVVDTYIMEMYLQKKMDKVREREMEMLAEEAAEAQAAAEADGAVVGVKIKPREPTSPKHPGLGLKKLAWARLKRDIQKAGRGHDSYEDALATRDLLRWHIESDLL